MIRVDVGVYTALEIDLTDFDFSGIEKVVMSVKNKMDCGILFTREFTQPGIHMVSITPEESNMLRYDAEYDFDIITTDGKRYKNGANGRIALRRGVGVCSESG